MKNKIAAILLAVSAFAAPLAARADLIFYEGFQYTNGVLPTVSTNLWTIFSGSQDMFVESSNLQVGSTGGTLSRSGDAYRPLGHPYDQSLQVLYASFTVICTNLPNGAGTYFAAFYNTNASPLPGGYSGRIQSFTNFTVTPNTWRLGATGNAAATNAANGGLAVDLALNTPYQVVARLDPITLQACTVWVNPISESDQGYTSSDSIGFAKTNGDQINAFAFRQASSAAGAANNWFGIITNLALGTNFSEVLTNIEPTNAVDPVMAVSPVGYTNFTGVPFSLFGVANGQGQISMT
jgi:hypothetical protein